MGKRLHQTYLMVSDLKRSTQFYEDALDLTVAERGDRSVEFETGECALKLETDFDEETLAEFNLEPPDADRGDGAVLVVEVDDVEAVYEEARNADGETLIEPREVPWGRKMFLIRDPDGYVIEVSRPV